VKDLYIITADKSMECTVRAALQRHQSLGIRPIRFDIIHHPQKDSGVRSTGPQMLDLQLDRYQHGLLMLDWEGCGSPEKSALLEEASLNRQLQVKWDQRARAIVIVPELDVWIWGSDQALAPVIDWNVPGSIRDFIASKGFEMDEHLKPKRPKEAFECLLAHQGLSTSSSLYQKIASKISLPRCADPCFLRFRQILSEWFPFQPASYNDCTNTRAHF